MERVARVVRKVAQGVCGVGHGLFAYGPYQVDFCQCCPGDGRLVRCDAAVARRPEGHR